MKFILQKMANMVVYKLDHCSIDKIDFWCAIGYQVLLFADMFGVELE